MKRKHNGKGGDGVTTIGTVVERSVRARPTTAMVPVNLPPFLSARTVSRFLQVRRAKVYGHCRAGTWPGTRRASARRWMIRTRALLTWYGAQHKLPEAEAIADLAMFLPRSNRSAP